jgi:hypothetical protein
MLDWNPAPLSKLIIIRALPQACPPRVGWRWEAAEIGPVGNELRRLALEIFLKAQTTQYIIRLRGRLGVQWGSVHDFDDTPSMRKSSQGFTF